MNHEVDQHTGYEYKQIIAGNKWESLWKDGMANFGWQAENSRPRTVKRMPFALWIVAAPLSLLPWRPFQKQLHDHDSDKEVELSFKRDRKVEHKQELNQLALKFEHCVKAIESLEASLGMAATMAAVTVGLLGTAFLALATFSYLAGAIPFCIVMAVPGMLGWVAAPILYYQLKANRAHRIEAEIEEQQEKIDEICRAAYKLLAADA